MKGPKNASAPSTRDTLLDTERDHDRSTFHEPPGALQALPLWVVVLPPAWMVSVKVLQVEPSAFLVSLLTVVLP
jgi:hypothetical protein